MPFVKGKSGNAAGRPKGCREHKWQYLSVKEQLIEEGFNPISAMIQIARNEEYAVNTRRHAIKDLMDKSYPDLKAIEVTSDDQAIEELKGIKEEMRALILENIKEY
jgi:hypothetical protein